MEVNDAQIYRVLKETINQRFYGVIPEVNNLKELLNEKEQSLSAIEQFDLSNLAASLSAMDGQTALTTVINYLDKKINEDNHPLGDHKAEGNASEGNRQLVRDFMQMKKDMETLRNVSTEEIKQLRAENAELKKQLSAIGTRADTNIENLSKKIESSTRIKIELEGERYIGDKITIDNATHSQEHIIHCINKDLPIYISGPAGCGKSHDAELVALSLKLGEQVNYTIYNNGQVQTKTEEPQYFYPMNAIQQEYQIKGYKDANGFYHPTNFWKAFKFGGVLLLDELDASIPEVLVILNYAIANHKFEFPDGNGTTVAHKEFRIIATGNTNGMGSDELYTGRYQLDAASLNRFVQMKYDYDKQTEIDIIKDAEGNYDGNLITDIHKLRELCKTYKFPAIISYRQLKAVNDLVKSGLTKSEAYNLAIFNGLDEEMSMRLRSDMGWLK